MASELSRLIDDELDKVERQQRESDGKTARAAFQIKGPEKSSSEGSWRNLAWWTKNRIIAGAIIGVLLIITVLLLLPKSRSSATSDPLSIPGSALPSGKTGSTRGMPALSVNTSGWVPAPAPGPAVNDSSWGSPAPAPGPGLAPAPGPQQGEAPSLAELSPELAPQAAGAPSLGHNSSSPALEKGNSTAKPTPTVKPSPVRPGPLGTGR